MFQSIGMTREQAENIEQSRAQVAAALSAIIDILVANALCTTDEYDSRHAHHLAKIEQLMMALRAERDAELEKQHPGLSDWVKKLTGDKPH